MCDGFSSKADNEILLCDGMAKTCTVATHQLCTDPPLVKKPTFVEKWFCVGCDAGMDPQQSGRRSVPTAKKTGLR